MRAFEPKRLIEGQPHSPLVRALEGARADLGTTGEIARVHAALRASAGGVHGAGTVATASGAASGAVVKGTLLLGLALGGALAWNAWPSARVEAPVRAASVQRARTAPAEPMGVQPEAAATVPVEPAAARVELGEQVPQDKPHARRARGTAAATPSAAAPESEIALLRRAQALVDTRPTAALEALDQHARAHPSGTFTQERESLAIDAMRKLGRRHQARDRGLAFLTRYPNSPHARRIRAFVDLQPDAAGDHKNEPAPLPTR